MNHGGIIEHDNTNYRNNKRRPNSPPRGGRYRERDQHNNNHQEIQPDWPATKHDIALLMDQLGSMRERLIKFENKMTDLLMNPMPLPPPQVEQCDPRTGYCRPSTGQWADEANSCT